MITMINTRYSGPTDTRGARIIVTVRINTSGPLTRAIAYDDAFNSRENHIQAVLAALETMPPFARVTESAWLIAEDWASGFTFIPDRAANRVTFSIGV